MSETAEVPEKNEILIIEIKIGADTFKASGSGPDMAIATESFMKLALAPLVSKLTLEKHDCENEISRLNELILAVEEIKNIQATLLKEQSK